MTEAAAALKLEAVGRVVEQLLRLCSEQPGCEVFYPIGDLASELRGIVEAVAPTGGTPTEQAMIELALWSRRHSSAVDAGALEGALLTELVSVEHDAGRSRAAFLARCEMVWDSLSLVRATLDAAELAAGLVCADDDCVACERHG